MKIWPAVSKKLPCLTLPISQSLTYYLQLLLHKNLNLLLPASGYVDCTCLVQSSSSSSTAWSSIISWAHFTLHTRHANNNRNIMRNRKKPVRVEIESNTSPGRRHLLLFLLIRHKLLVDQVSDGGRWCVHGTDIGDGYANWMVVLHCKQLQPATAIDETFASER